LSDTQKKIKRLIDYFSFEHGRLGKNGNFRLFCEFRVHKSENIKQKNALRLRKLPNGIKLLLRSIKWGGYKKRKWLAP
jgi:hypothetical protein